MVQLSTCDVHRAIGLEYEENDYGGPIAIRSVDRARLWITSVNRFGGHHLGYFLPSEGASNIAYALFTFASLAAYENYRLAASTDPECIRTMEIAERSRCIVSYERRFLRPVTDGL